MAKNRRVRRVRPAAKNSTSAVEENTLPKRSAEEIFKDEYAYVLKDLQRVFIIAGAMFLLLIALNLVMQ